MKLLHIPFFAVAALSFGMSLARAETVLIDFGNDSSFRGVSVPNPDPNGNVWNSVKPGAFFSNLADITGAATDIDFGPGSHGTDSYNGPAGPTDAGITEIMLLTLDVDKVALGNLGVAEAAIDFIAGKLADASGHFQIQGLNPSGKYTLTFFCSHKYNASNTTRINVYDDSDRLNRIATADILVGSGAAHNRDTLVVMPDLLPSPNGIFYLEFGGADGLNSGYINCMQVTTEGGGGGPGDDPDPEPDQGIKLVVAGSSVPVGFAASLAGTYYHDYDQEGNTGKDYWDYAYAVHGYAGRLRLALTQPARPQVPGGSTTPWEFVNVSVPGDTTTLVRNRFDPDVTRQYAAPKVAHAEPDYVMIALSLANEGLVYTSNPQAVFDSFRNGMLDLIEQCRTRGYYPVVTLVYPHSDYTPEKYGYVKEMNLLMNTWGVPAINLLGAIDNGEGQWADGFVYDPGHPNFLGHEEMYLAIPPTLFDAIHFDGKRDVPSYPVSDGHVRLTNGVQGAESVTFTPDSTLRAFTTSFRIRTDAPGALAGVRARYEPAFLVDFGPANVDDGRPTASPDANGFHWNNWAPVDGGVTIPSGTLLENLVRVDGSPSAVALEVTTVFGGSNGLQNGGLFGAEGPDPGLLGHFAVESATEDYFYTTSTSVFRIKGLDPDRRYTLRFFGTRAASDARETRFRVTGTTAEINYSPFVDIVTSGTGTGSNGTYAGNDSAIGLVSGIQPRANGEIFVEVLPDVGGFAYIGAMEVSIDTASDRYGAIEAREGGLAYVAPDGRAIVTTIDVADSEWHDIALSHRYAQQQTLLYVDGVHAGTLRENLEPDQFVLGGPGAGGVAAAPAGADFQDWAVYRTAWTAEEALAQHHGELQHASMEILAPLDDAEFVKGSPVNNLAQTRSQAVFNTTASVSFWGGEPGSKETGIGWINDVFWPFIYHYGSAEWLAVVEEASTGRYSFVSYAFGDGSWLWSSDALGGWYYNFNLVDWFAFSPQG